MHSVNCESVLFIQIGRQPDIHTIDEKLSERVK